MNFFEHIEQAPPDPILGLSVSFTADPRPDKVNLGAGVYKSADLKPFILNSVKKAEARILQTESSKDYLPIDGLHEYVQLTKNLVFGEKYAHSRIYGAHTVGGTAALRVGGRFLKETGLSTIYLSVPTWANHQRVFLHAGMQVHKYPYFDWKSKGMDFHGFIEALHTMEEKSVVLLQVCCHNPTGFDPTLEQWQQICSLMKKRRLFPFFDFAYQGFGDDLQMDAAPLQIFMQEGLECAVAVSHAKNFGLYAERCGVLFMVCHDEESAHRVGSRIRMLIRGLYSNPPCHGARIVAAILQDTQLKAQWQEELAAMRTRIQEVRKALCAGLQAKAVSSFDFLALQKGMFSYTGLREDQVQRLLVDYGIYLPKDGRINVAGLNSENLDYVIEAILAVE